MSKKVLIQVNSVLVFALPFWKHISFTFCWDVSSTKWELLESKWEHHSSQFRVLPINKTCKNKLHLILTFPWHNKTLHELKNGIKLIISKNFSVAFPHFKGITISIHLFTCCVIFRNVRLESKNNSGYCRINIKSIN